MSLSNCIQKAGKALNVRDAESITNIADEIEASGVDRVDAEKQAIEQHLGTMQSDIDALVPLKQESDTDVETPRGSFEGLFTGVHTINLSEISDMSTFLHESMHLFVSMEGIFAKENGLSANNKAMLDHVGAKSFDELTVEQHESLAESFEVYLREGKAPSVAMADAFHVFKKWLTTVYQTLRNLPRQKLDPELSQIFDRMLATEAEIAEVAAHPEYQELFRSKEQAGMTDAQWTEYQQAVEKRKNRAEETVTQKIIKQLRNRKTKEWRQEKAPLIDQEMERLSELPVYQILSDTRHDKMDYSLVHKIVGGNKKILGKLARNLKKDGTPPDIYSEGYGYDSPAQMFKDIGDNKALGDAAKDAAEAIMVSKYGDILNDGTIEQEAHEALSSDIDEKILLMELKAMNKGKGDINNSLLKNAARKLVGTMKQSDIKPDKYKRLERKAALRAERADAEAEKLAEQYEKANAKDADKRNDKEKATIAKGKPPTADQIRFEAKKQQMANKHLYREATTQRKNINRWTDHIRKVSKAVYKPRDVDTAYSGAMNMIANLYQRKRKGKDAAEQTKKDLDKAYDFYYGKENMLNERLTQEDPQLAKMKEILDNKQSLEDNFEFTYFEDMTVDQIEGVYRNLVNLRFAGGQIKNDAHDNKADIAKARKGAEDNKTPEREQKAKSVFDAPKRGIKGIMGGLSNLRNKIRKIDGFQEDDMGASFDTVHLPVEAAHNHLLALKRKLFEQYREELHGINTVAINSMPWNKQDIVRDSGKAFHFSTEERFMIAMYWGTESSRKEVMQSYGLTEADAMRVMSTASDSELQLVNSLWKLNDLMFDGVAKTAREHKGIAPKKLKATPFVVNGVEMTGGHQTIYYEGNAEGLAIVGETDKQMMSPLAVGQATSSKERVGSGGRKLNLSKDNITRAIDENLHYEAFYETSVKVAAIVNDSEYRNSIVSKHGQEFYDSYVKVLQNVVTAKPDPDVWWDGIRAFLRHVRRARTAAVLHYSIKNTLQQTTSWIPAVQDVGFGNFIEASSRLIPGAEGSTELISIIKEKSKFMENRAHLVNREANEFIREIAIGGSAESMWKAYTDNGFFMQTKMDSMIATPVWLAKYESSIAKEGVSEAAAISMADTAVAESVGSGADLHLGSMFQSTSPQVIKNLTQFMTWFNNYYNRAYRDTKGFSSFEHKRKVLNATIATPIALAILNELVTGGGPDDEESYAAWVRDIYISFAASPFPIIGDVVSAYEGWRQTGSIEEATGAIYPLKRLFTENEKTGNMRITEQSAVKTVSDIIKALNKVIVLGGSGQITKALDVIESESQGREDDSSTAGLLFKATVSGPTRN